jgi:hypothetical protein
MDDTNSLFPQEDPPKIDPAYFQKIDAELKELMERIPVVARQPSTEKIWCKTDSLWYGHPVTPLILRPTSETVWTNAGTTSPSYTFRGLKSFTKYWFRIVALGPNGQTVYSPVDFRVIQ